MRIFFKGFLLFVKAWIMEPQRRLLASEGVRRGVCLPPHPSPARGQLILLAVCGPPAIQDEDVWAGGLKIGPIFCSDS